IQDACNAFESVLKTLTGKGGNAGGLIGHFLKIGAGDLPAQKHRALKEALQALPTLGNNLGRHGQGPEVIDVHPRYAQLAVHLAGAFIIFAVESVSLNGPSEAEPEAERVNSDWDEEPPF